MHQSTEKGFRAIRNCVVGGSLPFHSWLQIACMADGALRVPCLLGGGSSSHRDNVSKGGWSLFIALPSKSASGGSIPVCWCKWCVGEGVWCVSSCAVISKQSVARSLAGGCGCVFQCASLALRQGGVPGLALVFCASTGWLSLAYMPWGPWYALLEAEA